jgi:exodeoxyribonuclease VII small subunit
MPEMKYAKAMQRLEEIIKRIEHDEIDVDELSEQVKEAVALVRLCQDKIKKADLEVKEVVERFEKEQEK